MPTGVYDRRTSQQAPPERRTLAARIAKIEGRNGPGDPRLPALRRQLGAIRAIDELRAWTERNAAACPPLRHEEIDAIGALADRLDRRLADQATEGGAA